MYTGLAGSGVAERVGQARIRRPGFSVESFGWNIGKRRVGVQGRLGGFPRYAYKHNTYPWSLVFEVGTRTAALASSLARSFAYSRAHRDGLLICRCAHISELVRISSDVYILYPANRAGYRRGDSQGAGVAASSDRDISIDMN